MLPLPLPEAEASVTSSLRPPSKCQDSTARILPSLHACAERDQAGAVRLQTNRDMRSRSSSQHQTVNQSLYARSPELALLSSVSRFYRLQQAWCVALMREQEGGDATGREALGKEALSMEALGKRKREDGGSEVPEKWARREDSMGARNAGVEVAEARGSVEEPRRRRRCKTSWDGAQARSESIPTEVGAGHPEDPLSIAGTHSRETFYLQTSHPFTDSGPGRRPLFASPPQSPSASSSNDRSLFSTRRSPESIGLQDIVAQFGDLARLRSQSCDGLRVLCTHSRPAGGSFGAGSSHTRSRTT